MFDKVPFDEEEMMAINPYGGKNSDGEWVKGYISIDYLNNYFGQYETAEEMINATESEGLKLYFQYLKDEGILR